MVAILHDRRLIGRLPLIVAIVAAGVAVAGIAVLPEWRLTALVEALELPALLSAASPPLGTTARAMLALLAGGVAAGAGWGATMLAIRDTAKPDDGDVPVLRRADAHPDAPARRPIRASEDLGQPLPIVVKTKATVPPRVEAVDVPIDLDTPMAAIDPAAIPDVPREPVRPVAPLAARPQIIDVGERFETFALTPIRRTAKPASVHTAPVSSIGSLIERLEKGAARRDARPAATIEETLGMLRALATR